MARKRNIYDPLSDKPYRLSRSKIDLFLNCPRCFYLDRRLGVSQPPGYPFNLNSAVDALLKKEFDAHRVSKTPHLLMTENGINGVPFQHEKLEEWRDSLHKGITYHHCPTNLIITGGVDDVWVTPENSLIIVDYKATSKKDEVSLDADWQIGYKRQVEIYQWLFRQNGFTVSNTAYFVYCNGDSSKEAFNARLDFRIKLLPYIGDDSWVEEKIRAAHECLMASVIPVVGEGCAFCEYRAAAKLVESI